MHIASYRWLLFSILLVTLLLRVWGIRFGMPFSYAIDEYHEVMRALQLAAGDFNFNRTGKGGLYYLLLIQYGIYFVVLKVTGVVDTTMDFAMHFVRDQAPFYLMGRWLVAVIGTISVYAAFLLGRKAYSPVSGLLAASLLAVNALHAYESHTINVDIPMITLATFALLYAIKLAESGGHRHYYLAALFAGLATTTKMPAILLVVPLFMAHALFSSRSGRGVSGMFLFKPLWVGAGIMAGVVIVTNPGIVLAFPGDVMRAMHLLTGVLADNGMSGGPGIADGENGESVVARNLHLYYLNAMAATMGWPLVVASVLAVAYAAWKRTAADLVLLSFAVALYVLFTGPVAGDMYYERYFLPIVVVVMVFAGRMFDDAFRLARGPAGKAGVIGLVGALMLIPAYLSITQNIALAGPDTRDIARNWVEENMPHGARVFIESGKIAPVRGTVQLQDTLEMVERRIDYWAEVEPRQARFLEIRRKVMAEHKDEPGVAFELMLVMPGTSRDLAYYRSYGVEYFVMRPEFFRAGPAVGWDGKDLLEELRSDPNVKLVFSLERPRPRNRRGGGPSIEIYRMEYGPDYLQLEFPDVPVASARTAE